MRTSAVQQTQEDYVPIRFPWPTTPAKKEEHAGKLSKTPLFEERLLINNPELENLSKQQQTALLQNQAALQREATAPNLIASQEEQIVVKKESKPSEITTATTDTKGLSSDTTQGIITDDTNHKNSSPPTSPPPPEGNKNPKADSKIANTNTLWGLGLATVGLGVLSGLAHFTDVFRNSKDTASLISDALFLFTATLFAAGKIGYPSPSNAELSNISGQG